MTIRTRQVLIRVCPFASGILGAAAFALVLRVSGLGGWFHFALSSFLWLGGGWLGANWPSWRNSRGNRLGKSWTHGIVFAALPVFLLLWKMGALREGLCALGMALNVTYLGAKFRCSLIGCCWARRKSALRKPLLSMGVSLQQFECWITCAILILAAGLFTIDQFPTCAALLFLGHAALRTYGLLLKMPHRNWNDLLRNPSISGSCVVGVIAVFFT